MRDLELPKHGLQIIGIEGGTVFTKNGDYLASYRNYHSKRREMARFSIKDSEAYERYSRDVTRQCRFIQPLLMRTAPDPASFKLKDISEIFYLIKKFNELTPNQMAETIRFWTMSISDYLDGYFENDVIKSGEHKTQDAIDFWDMTNKQDWYISELSQLGIQSKKYSPAPYSGQESLLAAFDKYYLSELNSLV